MPTESSLEIKKIENYNIYTNIMFLYKHFFSFNLKRY